MFASFWKTVLSERNFYIFSKMHFKIISACKVGLTCSKTDKINKLEQNTNQFDKYLRNPAGIFVHFFFTKSRITHTWEQDVIDNLGGLLKY